MSARLNFLLLTKTYLSYAYQLRVWFEYHANRFPNSVFTVINNDSEADVKRILDCSMPKYRYKLIEVHGFPDQTKLYSHILNSKEYRDWFRKGDCVVVIDDDEFLYLNDDNLPKIMYLTESSFFEKAFEYTDVIVIPETLMSTQTIYDKLPRNKPLPLIAEYRKIEEAVQVKPIIKYDPERVYEFRKDEADGTWHVPWIDGKKADAHVIDGWLTGNDQIEIYHKSTNGSGFAKLNPESHLKIFHYQVKSKADWEAKIKRGSSASLKPWYAVNLEDNYFAQGYDTYDPTMANELTRVISEQRFTWFGDFSVEESSLENSTLAQKKKWKESKNGSKNSEGSCPSYEDFRFAKTLDEKIELSKAWIHSKHPQIQLNGENIVNLINYYKLYDLDPKKSVWADKIAVRGELYDLGMEEIIIPSIFEKYRPDESEISKILDVASRYDSIVKCNHGSGWNIKFTPYGEKVNYKYLTSKFMDWLSTNYAYIAGYEFQYENMVPGILVQPNIFPEGDVKDYQFYCVNGEILAVEIQVKISKVMIKHLAFLDPEGNKLNWLIGSNPDRGYFTKDEQAAINKMVPYVKEISSRFKFIRVDMLCKDLKPYFCEATFAPCSGVLDYLEFPKNEHYDKYTNFSHLVSANIN